jgi:hypothetical protein
MSGADANNLAYGVGSAQTLKVSTKALSHDDFGRRIVGVLRKKALFYAFFPPYNLRPYGITP